MNKINVKGLIRNIQPSHVIKDIEYNKADLIVTRKDGKETRYTSYSSIEYVPDFDAYSPYSEHGTHVAGIIGGSSETITGVATKTQLVLMKVFPDISTGARTSDILAALEDATVLGVDAVNMSLGSSCGFDRECDNDFADDYEGSADGSRA